MGRGYENETQVQLYNKTQVWFYIGKFFIMFIHIGKFIYIYIYIYIYKKEVYDSY